MEEFFKRFPQLSEDFVMQLDYQSLVKCKEASRQIRKFLGRGRLLYTQVILKYIKKFEEYKEDWRKVLKKSSVEFIKEVATTVLIFSEKNHKFNRFAISKKWI